MKIIGFNQGQIGDLVMNLICCRSLKNKYPNCKITFGINKKYESIVPIFYKNELIDDIKIWENYDNWPSIEDSNYLNNNKFDLIYNPMPQHKNQNWYLSMHHTEAVCDMHDIAPVKDLQISLNECFEIDEKYKNCIALTCFSSAGEIRDIPIDIANKMIDYIHCLGFETIQLGLKSHVKLNTTYPIIGGSIFNDVKIAKSCKLLITTDTGMNWIMSGYKHKVLGLYSYKTYPEKAPLKNRTPINPNAIYLESDYIQNINIEEIFRSINKLSI
jgi:ADP-heptose:LPS heptosyltransferase